MYSNHKDFNFLDISNGARIIYSTDLKEYFPSQNVLDSNLNNLWITTNIIPQSFYVDITNLKTRPKTNNFNFFGIILANAYQRNPKEIELYFSNDNRVYDLVGIYELDLRPGIQIFRINNKNYDKKKEINYLRIRVTKTYGAERTYINQILLFNTLNGIDINSKLYEDDIQNEKRKKYQGIKTDNDNLNNNSNNNNIICNKQPYSHSIDNHYCHTTGNINTNCKILNENNSTMNNYLMNNQKINNQFIIKNNSENNIRKSNYTLKNNKQELLSFNNYLLNDNINNINNIKKINDNNLNNEIKEGKLNRIKKIDNNLQISIINPNNVPDKDTKPYIENYNNINFNKTNNELHSPLMTYENKMINVFKTESPESNIRTIKDQLIKTNNNFFTINKNKINNKNYCTQNHFNKSNKNNPMIKHYPTINSLLKISYYNNNNNIIKNILKTKYNIDDNKNQNQIDCKKYINKNNKQGILLKKECNNCNNCNKKNKKNLLNKRRCNSEKKQKIIKKILDSKVKYENYLNKKGFTTDKNQYLYTAGEPKHKNIFNEQNIDYPSSNKNYNCNTEYNYCINNNIYKSNENTKENYCLNYENNGSYEDELKKDFNVKLKDIDDTLKIMIDPKKLPFFEKDDNKNNIYFNYLNSGVSDSELKNSSLSGNPQYKSLSISEQNNPFYIDNINNLEDKNNNLYSIDENYNTTQNIYNMHNQRLNRQNLYLNQNNSRELSLDTRSILELNNNHIKDKENIEYNLINKYLKNNNNRNNSNNNKYYINTDTNFNKCNHRRILDNLVQMKNNLIYNNTKNTQGNDDILLKKYNKNELISSFQINNQEERNNQQLLKKRNNSFDINHSNIRSKNSLINGNQIYNDKINHLLYLNNCNSLKIKKNNINNKRKNNNINNIKMYDYKNKKNINKLNAYLPNSSLKKGFWKDQYLPNDELSAFKELKCFNYLKKKSNTIKKEKEDCLNKINALNECLKQYLNTGKNINDYINSI